MVVFIGAHMESKTSVKACRIKYDKCQIKKSRNCSVIFCILFIAVFIFLSVMSDSCPVVVQVLFSVVYMCSGPAFLYSGYQFLAGICYIRRLEKNGYEIPDNKKDYDGLLDNLPRKEQMVQKETYGRASLLLGVMGACATLGCVVCSVVYVMNWYFMESVAFMLAMQSVFDIILLARTVLFFRQINVDKYKDDVVRDETRKNRMCFPEGLLIIVMLLVLSVFAKMTVISMTKYVFKAGISYDTETVQSIREALTTTYTDLAADNSDWEQTEQSLSEGVDITTWGVPCDSFQKEVAMMLEISDFSELKDKFHVTDGPAEVQVKLKNEEFNVQVLNVNKKVEVEISAP